ncbi:uncharacterized protein CBL_04066 [Carabus blaptoides fortunei]
MDTNTAVTASTPKNSTISESKLHVTINETSSPSTDNKQFVRGSRKERATSQATKPEKKIRASTPKQSKMNADLTPMNTSQTRGAPSRLKMSLYSGSAMLRASKKSFAYSLIESQKKKSKMAFASLLSVRRGSYASKDPKKAVKYMNTYKLHADNPFNVDKVQSILIQVLTELITDDMIYDPEVCRSKAVQTSNTIRSRVKEQEYDRYKLVCVVTIGEKKSHDIMSCAKFLWDSERDRYATYMHENMRIFAVATVFGLYYE